MRRLLFLVPVFVSFAGAQTLTEMSGAVAGGAIGSAAGKKVSEGITAIFGKVDATTKKAAKPEDPAKKEPLLEVGEGVPRRASSPESVPPPPPPAGAHRAVKPPVPEPAPEVLPPPPPPPPPPQVTSEDLKKVAEGMKRDDLLKLGAPAARITMDDDGHLMETYTYYAKDTAIGRVKLTDGSVTKVEVW
ncbi:MAG TPA: hypothetical protein VMT15_10120 [Bryobacteraceae bacterium]|nr:hypothetical protein [Bryobacteraceae bacterium]